MIPSYVFISGRVLRQSLHLRDDLWIQSIEDDEDSNNFILNNTQNISALNPEFVVANPSTIQENTTAAKLVCQECGKSFPFYHHLKTHIDKMHKASNLCSKSKQGKTKVCEICAQEFPTSALRLQHIKDNHSESLFQCDLCSGHFSRHSYLLKHKRIRHEIK